jgi:hypothetical protein
MEKIFTRLASILAFTFFVAATITAEARVAHPADSATLEGRWNLKIMIDGKEAPGWLEIRHSGHKTLVGHTVVVVGSARPISKVNVNGNSFNFSIPPQWEQGEGDMKFEGNLQGKEISGTVIFPDGKNYTWSGVRAPSLRDRKENQWGKPIHLIQGSDTKGWHVSGENQWVVEKGILRSPKSGANLITDQKFQDFKLHVEFRIPKGSNSGIYLRGRYEVQISDSKGLEPLPGELGGVYGFIAPSEQVAKAPGEWQTYDITLIGRMVTVVANGKTIIANQEIPGITGGALDADESEAGSIMVQGDHGPVELRNIVITPMK